jgi:hypothetical protein
MAIGICQVNPRFDWIRFEGRATQQFSMNEFFDSLDERNITSMSPADTHNGHTGWPAARSASATALHRLAPELYTVGWIAAGPPPDTPVAQNSKPAPQVFHTAPMPQGA